MGGLISKPKTWFSVARGAFLFLKGLAADYDALTKRIETSPGIPQVNSDPRILPPYWTVPRASIARRGEKSPLPPDDVDVVIIGSGITGTSVARELLHASNGSPGEIKVVMLEARDACSGATGRTHRTVCRNGGHITPNIYNEYADLKKQYGVDTAEHILRFRMAHINGLIALAKQENLLSESQARLVEAFDVYAHPDFWKRSVDELAEFAKELPELADGFAAFSGREEIEHLQLISSIIGYITKPGGSIHPYRLVTGILKNLLDEYHDTFHLFTHTPCTSITSTPDSPTYTVHTPRGDIRTKHIVHATNAWCSHLLPGLRGKVIPARTTMTALRPGKGLHQPISPSIPAWLPGTRNFVFYPNNDDTVFEYLTQQPPPAPDSEDPSDSAGKERSSQRPMSRSLPSNGELMFGGRTSASFLDNVGVFDDSTPVFADQAHLSGAIERYFADTWGEEGSASTDGPIDHEAGANDHDEVEVQWGKGRVKAAWSGVLGLSADFMPWVGRVPASVSGRAVPANSANKSDSLSMPLAPSGEWVSAGYTGEGMTHAWLSGYALARMLLNRAPDATVLKSVSKSMELASENENESEGDGAWQVPLPRPFLITEKRVKEAQIENLVDRIAG